MFGFKLIKKVYEEFWKGNSYSKTVMYGIGDVWEGPNPLQDKGVEPGHSTILAVEAYRDSIYILQGGHYKSWLKVVSPNGIRVYELGSILILMTQNSLPPYFSMSVINEDEIIAGYAYLNLKQQFLAPFGIDLSDLYKNPSFNISNIRVNSISWISAIRDIGGWHLYLHTKSSPEECLPCDKKKKFAKRDFECKEIPYSRPAYIMPGYEFDGLSVSRGEKGKRLPVPKANPETCIKAIDKYFSLHNQAKVSPADIGRVGYLISNNCNSTLYSNMIEATEYRSGVSLMRKEYLYRLLKGKNDINYLTAESERLAGLIGEFIYGISKYLGDNSFTKKLIRNTEWWAPIWFNANRDKLKALSNTDNAYQLLYGIDMISDFIPLLKRVAVPPMVSDGAKEMGWIIVGSKNKPIYKYSKTNMTYFRFPKAGCIGIRKLFTISNPREIDGICGVETRANGLIVWGLKYGISSKLICYLYSNDGQVSKIAEHSIDEKFTPVSNAPMAVTHMGSSWGIRDFFLANKNKIDYIDTIVKIGDDMQELLQVSTILNYANINDVVGSRASTEGSHYGDGLLDNDFSPYDLDDNQIEINHK